VRFGRMAAIWRRRAGASGGCDATSKAQFRFAVLADIQYADRPDVISRRSPDTTAIRSARWSSAWRNSTPGRPRSRWTLATQSRDSPFTRQQDEIAGGHAYRSGRYNQLTARNITPSAITACSWAGRNCWSGVADEHFLRFREADAPSWAFVVLDGVGLAGPDQARQVDWLAATLKRASGERNG